jgi:hypothetical protein
MANNDGTTRWCDVRLVISESGAEASVLRCGNGAGVENGRAEAANAPEQVPLFDPLPWAE